MLPSSDTVSYNEDDDDDDLFHDAPSIDGKEGEDHDNACPMSVEETDGALCLTESYP